MTGFGRPRRVSLPAYAQAGFYYLAHGLYCCKLLRGNAMQVTKSTALSLMDTELEKVRDAVKGAPFIKRKGQQYLPDPSNVRMEDRDQQDQFRALESYKTYKHNAEFDEYTGQTQQTMIGKLSFNQASIELPDRIQYLEHSSDGDGLSFRGILENTAQNVLAAKWHVIVADYKGLTGLDVNSASIADIESANPRVVFKEYPRESVYQAHFTVVNGYKQLSFLMLREVGIDFDHDTLVEVEVESFLILGLDESGNYYQRKIANNANGDAQSDSGNMPVTVSGQPLKFIPAYIASDEELTTGDLPQELGFLSPIAALCIHRYNVSARFKQAMAKFDPTIFVSGMTEETFEATKKINGRSSIEMGGVNVLAGNDNGDSPNVEILSASGELVDYHKYDEESIQKLRSLGATIPTESSQETATKARIDAAAQTAVLNPLVDNLEKMSETLLKYAAMFEGLISPDQVNKEYEQVSVTLNRDFAQTKGAPEELTAIVNFYSAGLATKEQAVRMAYELGWHTQDLEDVLQEINGESLI